MKDIRFLRSIIVFLACFATINVVIVEARGPGGNQAIEEALKVLYKDVRDAFVFIGGGSGVIISEDGLMVTNYHVINPSHPKKTNKIKKSYRVRTGAGISYNAHVLGMDKRGDLALLKIQAKEKLSYLKLGDSDKVTVGQFIIVIGNPFNIGKVNASPSLSCGVVSANYYFSHPSLSDAIVVDAAINPGNSGGPLINMQGELIGLNSRISTRWGFRSNTGIGLAIPVNRIKRWLPLLKIAKGTDVPHGAIPGIQFDGGFDAPQNGAKIQSIVPDSEGERFGLKVGDIIIEINGYEIWNVSRALGLFLNYPNKSEMVIKLLRNNEELILKETLRYHRLGRFGLQVARYDPQQENKPKHVKIGRLQPGSPAEQSGLRVGDYILKLSDRPVEGKTIDDKYQMVVKWLRSSIYPGKAMTLTIGRQEKADKYTEYTFTIMPE